MLHTNHEAAKTLWRPTEHGVSEGIDPAHRVAVVGYQELDDDGHEGGKLGWLCEMRIDVYLYHHGLGHEVMIGDDENVLPDYLFHAEKDGQPLELKFDDDCDDLVLIKDDDERWERCR